MKSVKNLKFSNFKKLADFFVDFCFNQVKVKNQIKRRCLLTTKLTMFQIL